MTDPEPAPAAPPAPPWPVLAGLGVAAFVVRVVYALAADPNILDVSDAGGYRLLGHHLSQGLGYIRPYDLLLADVVRPTAEFPPGFPTLLAVLDGLGLDSVTEQRIGLAVVGAFTVVAIALLADRLLPRRWALGVGAVAAVHPALFQPESALLGESLFLTITVLLAIAVLDLRDRPDARRGLAVGLLGGLAFLTRSEGVVLAGLWVAPLLVAAGWRIRWQAAGAALTGVVLVGGGWAARNLGTFEEPVLASNNLGSALAGANCDATYSGPNVGFWLISDDCFTGFDQAALAAGDESTVASFHRDDGVDYIGDHVGELPRVMTIRVLRTFQLYEPEQQARLATFEGRRLLTERIGGWIGWGTYPLAAAGLVVLLRRRRWFDAWFLALPVGVVVAVSALTYGNPRFRIGAEVPMLLLAAVALSAVADRAAAGRARPTA